MAKSAVMKVKKNVMKSKQVSKDVLKKFKGGVPKAQRRVKGSPDGKVVATRAERGKGLKFALETYQTVSSFKPGTKIKYGPNPKTPGSKSFARFSRYAKAKSVGESLKCGAKLADLCWELQRGQYTVLGGDRSEKEERAAIGDTWYKKSEKLLQCFNGPRGLNLNLADPKAAEALKKEEAWREKKLKRVEELAKTFKIKIENEKELSKMGIHEAQELHAERKVCDAICAKRLQEAAKSGKNITDDNLKEALSLWGFAQNVGRLNVMREGVKYVYSDTIGAIRRRASGYGLTPPTRHYPNFVKLLSKWLVDNKLEQKLGCDFKFTAINLNANYAGARHRDGGNEGPSVLRAVGEFTGGKLRYWPKDNRKTLDTKFIHKLDLKDSVVHDVGKETVIFDGNRAHEVEAFSGDRYSVVFFSTSGFQKVPGADVKYLESLGVPYPSIKEMATLKLATGKFVDGKAKVSSAGKLKPVSNKVKKFLKKK